MSSIQQLLVLSLLSVFPACQAGGLRVEGLTSTERFVLLPAEVTASPAADGEHFESGRVVDARTDAPIAGARLESWTEELDATAPGFRRIGEATAGRDGQFRLRVREGALSGDKVLIRAPGYLAFAGTVSDLELFELMPSFATPSLLILDLADRPVGAARITSTYSCSHDAPAFERESDASGLVELPEYGLQDHVGELRVRAPGFGAIASVSAYRVLPDAQSCAAQEPAILRLARRRTLRARVLDAGGRPLVGEPLHVIDGQGYHVPFTGKDGGFEVSSCYDGREPTIRLLSEGPSPFVYAGPLPHDRAVTLRIGSDTIPSDV